MRVRSALLKITIFGLTLSSSWGNGHATPYRAILRALARAGHEITFFEKDVPYYARHRDFIECDYCELKLYESWQECRRHALATGAESDIVVMASYCPEGAHIADEVLGLGQPLVVYYDLDAPVTLAKLRAGEPVDYIRAEQLREFDLVLSWTGGRALEDLHRDWGVEIVRPLYGCVDSDIYRRQSARDEFRCALSYMGTYARDRQERLDALFLEPSRRRRDLHFLLAGSLYPWEWQWGTNVTKMEHVAPPDHPSLYSSSRCTLNITRADMAASGYCPSGRFFEAAACATPIISDWFDGLDQFFTPGEQIFIAHSVDDTLQALNKDDADLQRIGARARERTLDEHTGDHRAREFLRYCEEAWVRASRRDYRRPTQAEGFGEVA
jgi:spore maturation protein CgeB